MATRPTGILISSKHLPRIWLNFSQVGPGISTTVLKWNRFWGTYLQKASASAIYQFYKTVFLQIAISPTRISILISSKHLPRIWLNFSQVGPGISTTVLKLNRFWGLTSKRHQHQPSTNFIILFFLQIGSRPTGILISFKHLPRIWLNFSQVGPGISTTVLKWNRFWGHTSKRHQHQPSTNFLRLFLYKWLLGPPGYWFPPNTYQVFGWIFPKFGPGISTTVKSGLGFGVLPPKGISISHLPIL